MSEPSNYRKQAEYLAAVSSPACKCKFHRGQLVSLCALCGALADEIEAMLKRAYEDGVKAILAQRQPPKTEEVSR